VIVANAEPLALGQEVLPPLRRRWSARPRIGDAVLTAFAVVVLAYLFLPIVTIVLFSFNNPASRFNLRWRGFTLDNWSDPFAKGALLDAMRYSLTIAFWAMVAATIMGTLVALALSRYRFRGGAFVNLFLVMPLTTPEVVLGASLLNLFVFADQPWLQRGFRTILVSHILFCMSFVAMTVKARVRGFDWTLEDAAMDLGAPPFRTFVKVTFPLILPGILAAALLSFALSIDDYIITTMVSPVGGRPTFPLYIAGAFQREISPQINVLSTMILGISVLLMASGSAFRLVREGRLSS
jgi:spermidine/putrescine transport system permease protein